MTHFSSAMELKAMYSGFKGGLRWRHGPESDLPRFNMVATDAFNRLPGSQLSTLEYQAQQFGSGYGYLQVEGIIVKSSRDSSVLFPRCR